MAEQLLDYEVQGESQIKEIQFVRTNNEFYVVYLEGHREVSRKLLGYQYTPSVNSFLAFKRDWRQQCQPP